jgi:hypothetical protein
LWECAVWKASIEEIVFLIVEEEQNRTNDLCVL